MSFKFQTWFRVYLFALFVLLGWCVWQAAAQNFAAAVKLVEPPEGTRFEPGVDMPLRAEVTDAANPPTRVEFLVDGTVLGVVTNAPYSMVWSNVPAGAYNLSARITAQNGDAVESAKVGVRVYRPLASSQWIEKLSVRVPFLRYEIWGNELWKYLFSLIYIFLAFYVSKILDFMTRVWLKRWTSKTKTTFDDLLLELLNGPVKVVSFIIFLRIGMDVFDWPVVVHKVLSKSFAIIVAISLTYMALKFIDLVMGYWRQRVKGEGDRSFDEQLFPMLRKSLKVFVIVVAAMVTLDNVGVDITAAIASLSIGGLAVGLAAQDTLANLFGAVSIFVDKPFKLGDRIKLDEVDGFVEAIGMRSTRVRNLDGHLITVPNKTMGNATIINITGRPNIKSIMNIGITYDTPAVKVKRALDLLGEIYKANPKTKDVIISFNQFNDYSLNLIVVHWWDSVDYRDYLGGMQELNLVIKERFDAEGIAFAFPTQTVYMKQDSDWRVQQPEQPGQLERAPMPPQPL
jgi:MscS family membrane protein